MKIPGQFSVTINTQVGPTRRVMIPDSGIGVSALVTAKTEPADISRGFMVLTAVGRVHLCPRAAKPFCCQLGAASGTFTRATSWSNTAITKATWTIQTGFPTEQGSALVKAVCKV